MDGTKEMTLGPESNRLLSMLDAHGAELHALLTRLTLRSAAALRRRTIPSATRVRDFSGKTDKGITIGATKAEIIKAYGEPESQEEAEGTVLLSYGKLRVNFTLVGDKVVEMMFNRP